MLGVVNDCVGRIRRSRRIRQSTPDATLARLIRPTPVVDMSPDKAFTPHPAKCPVLIQALGNVVPSSWLPPQSAVGSAPRESPHL